jgi:hypothetical protein
LLSVPALSAEDAVEGLPERRAPVEEGAGLSENSPGPQNPTPEQQLDTSSATTNPQPSAPTNNGIEPESPCGPRCQAAEQREIDDLAAQESMALSTEGLLGLTLWQTVIGGFGLGALAVTILLTVRATNAAVDSNRIARESAERQLRAYVNITAAFITPGNGRTICITIRYKNAGQTPAYRVTHDVRIRFSDEKSEAVDSKAPLGQFDMGSGLEMDWESIPVRFVNEDRWIAVLNGHSPLYVLGEFYYGDVFGKTKRHTFYRLKLAEGGTDLLPCAEGNEST